MVRYVGGEGGRGLTSHNFPNEKNQRIIEPFEFTLFQIAKAQTLCHRLQMLQTQVLKDISPKVKWETSPTQKRRKGEYVSLLQHKFIRCKPPWLFLKRRSLFFYERSNLVKFVRMSTSTVGAPTRLKQLSQSDVSFHMPRLEAVFFQHTNWATNKNSDIFH